MLVIFVGELVAFGGAERAVLALSRWLHERSLEHYVLAYRDGCGLASHAVHPVRVVDLQVGGGVRAKVAALRGHLRAQAAGALLGSGYQPALHLTLARARGFHDLMHDTPALFSDAPTRGFTGRVRTRAMNAIVGYGLRSGGQTMVTSEFLRGQCREDFGVEAEVVRMGGLAGAGVWRGKPVVRGGPLRLLTISRMEESKRIDWILHALARLEGEAVPPLETRLGELVDWHMDFVGKGARTAELTAMAAALGLGERVRFHGFVGDDELEAMLERANLFVMTAVQGYGIPAIEALERGVPVLVHRDSGVSDLLLETPWATVFDGGADATAGALARAIAGLLDGAQEGVALPSLPTEDEWAERVARLCGWVPA